MQELVIHFNKKKADFVIFLSSISQIIDKLSLDVQIEIDKEYNQALFQFRDFKPQDVRTVSFQMQQNRINVYQQIIDRLCQILINFAKQFNQSKNTVDSIKKSISINKPQKTNSNIVSAFSVEKKNFGAEVQSNKKVISVQNFNTTKENQKKRQKHQLRTPINSNILQQKLFLTPSPFAEKMRQIKLEQFSVGQQIISKQSKRRIDMLKKSDTFESFDNYLNKEAKEMINRTQKNSYASFNSLKKSINDQFTTPQKFNNQKQQTKAINKRIEEKFGVQNAERNVSQLRTYSQNLPLSIQMFKQA